MREGRRKGGRGRKENRRDRKREVGRMRENREGEIRKTGTGKIKGETAKVVMYEK